MSTAAQAGRVVAIHALNGMPGVGKTALAGHVGHRLADRFPDRQLFLDLHAHTPGQQLMTPQAALATLLTADGADARYLPESLEERAALWWDRMARKQVLLILDNAASSSQVTPLLPGSAGSLVVTSRRYLGDLPGAVSMLVDILPPEEAQQMFLRLAPRAATEPTTAAELVRLCGYLPLAISLLASLFTKHPSWSMGHLISETTTTLLTVAAENRTVAAAFNLSYRDLPTDRQRFFRRLGLHPGVDIDAYAAAALAGLPLGQAREHLDALHSDRLLEEPVCRRYRMHDLIRDYARTLVATDPAEEREQAVGWLLDYYQHTAVRADAHLTRYPQPGAAPPADPPEAAPGLASRSPALVWLRTERANLLACLDHATHHTHHTRMVGLTAGLASLLRSDGPWTQARQLHTTATAAARYLGDQLGEVEVFNHSGTLHRKLGDLEQALAHHQRALELVRAVNSPLEQAHALDGVCRCALDRGETASAVTQLRQALEIYQRLGAAEATQLAIDLGDLDAE